MQDNSNKNMMMAIAGVVIALVVIGGAYLLLNQNSGEGTNTASNSSASTSTAADSSSSSAPAVSSSATTSSAASVTSSASNSQAANVKGEYTSYDMAKLTDNKNVIFFAASWCPSCQALDKNINSSLGDIPADVRILKADYDKESALKQKYGVTYQHTLVQVDKSGKLLKKWSGGFALADVLKEVI